MLRLVALALLSSLLMALSQLTPFGWLALVGYVPLILATKDQSPKKAFFLAWLATLVQYTATLYWLLIAMTVFGHLNWVISFIGLVLVASILGCYVGGASALARYLNLKLGWSYYWLFAIAICAFEYLRNYGFIGAFPWGNSGNSLISVPILLQGASVVGVYGLVFYVGLVNGAVAKAFQFLSLPRRWEPRDEALSLDSRFRGNESIGIVFWSALLITVALISYGSWRLNNIDINLMPKIRTALLQGNIEQGIKNKAPLYGRQIIKRYQNLQDRAFIQGAKLVIWPESSYPYHLDEEDPKFPTIANLAQTNIIPSIAIDTKDNFYNSAYVLNQDSKILGRFDKSKLVPFGEYVPWPFDFLVKKLVPNLGSFAPGNNLKPINSDGLNIAVTVCYEGVFPEISRAFVNAGADLLINVTNDAWYGYSAGPYQHLDMYKIRSVEVGRSFARATNTGVSAWVDPLGRTHDETNLYEEVLVIAEIPISKINTIYGQIGDLLPQICLAILALALLIARRPRTKSDWLWFIFGSLMIFASHAYFEPAKLALQEEAFTKDSCVIFLGLFLGLRLWKSTSLKKG